MYKAEDIRKLSKEIEQENIKAEKIKMELTDCFLENLDKLSYEELIKVIGFSINFIDD